MPKDSVLFVSGIAGIGKSEFVKYFAEKYSKKYTNITYWFYSGDLKQNITEMDFTSDRMDMTDAQRFHAHFQHLKNLKKDSLIIIDNFNVLPKEEPMLKELMQYDFSILVTTRCRLTAFPVFEIKELDTDIASGEDVELYKDGEFSEGLMIEHLKKLLRITNLTEEQQYILCNLSLMPVSGIWKNPFGKWLRLASLSDINRLIKYGFISEDTERRTISLHPLIREISEKETQPTISACINLWDFLHAVIIVHGLDVSRPSVVINAIDSMINHIIIDNNEEYLLFLQDLFPYYEKYFVHSHNLENFVFSLSYRVKTNVRFAAACFPSDKIYYQKYKADEPMHKLVERIEYIMNEFHIAAPCDRALLLDYKAELLLEDDEAEQFFLDAERIFQHKVPQSSDYLENVRQYLYTTYMKQGRYSLADSYKT